MIWVQISNIMDAVDKKKLGKQLTSWDWSQRIMTGRKIAASPGEFLEPTGVWFWDSQLKQKMSQSGSQ